WASRLKHDEAALRGGLSSASTIGTDLGLRSLLGATASAGVTRCSPVDMDLFFDAFHRLAQRQSLMHAGVLAPLRSTSTSTPAPLKASKKIREHVLEVREDVAHAGIVKVKTSRQPLVSEAIVLSALVGVGQDRVRLRRFLELFLGAGVILVAVRMVLERQFPVGAADVVLGLGLFDGEDFVIIAFLAHGYRGRSPRRS